MSGLRQRATFSNVVSLVALFVALGGGAYAISLGKNSVKSKQIAPSAVGSSELKRNAAKGVDVAESTLGPVPNANEVGGIPPSQIGAVGRTNFELAACSDDDHNGADCTSVGFDLPRSGRVLVIGTATALVSVLDDASGADSGTDDPNTASGECQIALDGVMIGASAVFNLESLGDSESIAVNRVTAPLDPGTHTFALRCTEFDGALVWDRPSISAVMLGSG